VLGSPTHPHPHLSFSVISGINVHHFDCCSYEIHPIMDRSGNMSEKLKRNLDNNHAAGRYVMY